MQVSKIIRAITVTVAISFLTLAALPAAYAQAAEARIEAKTDPCSSSPKSSVPFFIDNGNFHQVIAGAPGKRIFVCNVVFSGSASQGFNITFAGSNSACNAGFTFLGSLFTTNDAVIAAGGGSSTQFTAPMDNAFCIELGGVTPLRASGWVSYVHR